MRSNRPGFQVLSALLALRKPLVAREWVALGSLRLPAYRYLLLNHTFGVLGNETRLMAQVWLILALTNSDAWVGTVVGLPAVAAAATTLLGGVLVDRLNRRTMLIVIHLVLAAVGLLTALLVVTGMVQIWHLLALAFVVALFSVSGTTTSQTLIIDIVPREQLFNANALYSATANLAMMVGPALAGILIAQAGVESAFYLSTVFLIGAALTTAKIQAPRRKRDRTPTSVWHDLKEGLAYVAQTRVLQWLLLLGVTIVAVGVWFALVPRHTLDVLEGGASGYGAILSARGAGGLVGMVMLIAVGQVKRLSLVLVACAVGFAGLVLAFAFSTSLPVAMGITFGLGVIFIWWPSTLRTAFQFAATEEMRGRVMSLFSLVGQILTLGWLVGGILSEVIGPQNAMITVALLCGAAHLSAYLRSPELRAIGREP